MAIKAGGKPQRKVFWSKWNYDVQKEFKVAAPKNNKTRKGIPIRPVGA